MKSMIFGAGSMGTVLGALLSRGGEDVLLVSRNRAHVDALNRNGAVISGGVTDTVPVKASVPEEIHGEYDVIMLMTKQHENPENAAFLLPHLKAEGMLCTSQNGCPELSLRGVIPDRQIAGCTISWSATRVGPGASMLTSSRESVCFTIGSPFAENPEGLALVQRLLSVAGPTGIDGDLLSLRWSKLQVNCAVSAVASLAGMLCGGAASDARLRPIALHTLREVIDVGHALGVRFRPVAGYDIAGLLYLRNESELPEKEALMPEIFDGIRNAESSILQDLKAGRRTEIRLINGIVCREGRRLGIPTPYNDAIVAIIEEIERGEAPLGAENIDTLLYRI